MGSVAGALGVDSLGFVILVSNCIYMETIRISVKELKFKIMLEWCSVHRAIIISYIKDERCGMLHLFGQLHPNICLLIQLKTESCLFSFRLIKASVLETKHVNKAMCLGLYILCAWWTEFL